MSNAAQPESSLFAEFAPPTHEEWVAAALASLKGKPLDRLTHLTYEGIPIEPLLGPAATADSLPPAPGQTPYRRGTRSEVNLDQPWLIAQQIEGSDPAQLNEQLKHDLARGQTAVTWPIDAHFTADHIRTILTGVTLAEVPLFIPSEHGLPPMALLAAARPDDLAHLRGGLLYDPVTWLAGEGSLPLEAMYDATAVLTRWAMANAPHLHTLAVMPALYRQCGGHAVQEIGLMLATAVHHIRQLQQRGLDISQIAPRLLAVLGLDSDFFMTIAKLRAARSVWAQMIAAFGGNETAQKLTLHSHTSESSRSRLDPHVNMLRATTEAFAAALGGANSIQISPFDALERAANGFSRRIARNVQLILQDEVNLAQLLDPAGGSYLVESLTDELAQRGWALFQEIEAVGGVVAALQKGVIQQQIEETAAARQKDLATRKAVMVGTNMYPNVGEKPLPAPESEGIWPTRKGERDPQPALAQLAAAAPTDQMARAVAAAEAGATLAQLSEALFAGAETVVVEPLRPFHADAPFFRLREWAGAYAERHGHPPRIFLANMGPLRQHKARADFTRGFFEVGGFEIVDSGGFAEVETAVAAALASGAPAVVICSTDETYPEIVPPLVQGIKQQQPDAIVILAGYPKDQVEAHKAAGIDAFIHFGADCLALNEWLQEIIGR
ncbi:MAG: methylmalonyl-CoA mutase small subunit [Anaerolineaceae bacterium]|nr:methylmalonyl-CoA mutase small subunit [Anaerolineaceae bacterium]